MNNCSRFVGALIESKSENTLYESIYCRVIINK